MARTYLKSAYKVIRDEYCYSPLDGRVVHHMVIASSMLLVPICTWVKTDNVKLSFLSERTIGNLSRDVFEPWTATGNWIFPVLERFDAIVFVISNHSHRQELFLSVVRSETMSKKETFNFQLPSVTHERLCLNSLMWWQSRGCASHYIPSDLMFSTLITTVTSPPNWV